MLINEKKSRNLYFLSYPIYKGVPKNFWHFYIGYFIPLSFYTFLNRSKLDSRIIKIESNIPILENQLELYFNRAGLNFKFITADERSKKNKEYIGRIRNYTNQISPRLSEYLFGLIDRMFFEIKLEEKDFIVKIHRLEYYIRRKKTLPDFYLKNLESYKNHMIKLAENCDCCEENQTFNDVLIIQRPERKDFLFDKSIKTDSQKRQLVINQLELEKLNSGEKKFRKYTPAFHNLFCQIKNFSNCSGVIAVRGSELANIFWMRPRTTVLMYETYTLPGRSPQKDLGEILDLNFKLIASSEKKRIDLKAEEIAPYFIN